MQNNVVSRETIDTDFVKWVKASVKYINDVSRRFRYTFYSDEHNNYNIYSYGFGMKTEYLHTSDKLECLEMIEEIMWAELSEQY